MNENVRKKILVHDRFFSLSLMQKIILCYRTDHSATTLKLKLQESGRGRGIGSSITLYLR